MDSYLGVVEELTTVSISRLPRSAIYGLMRCIAANKGAERCTFIFYNTVFNYKCLDYDICSTTDYSAFLRLYKGYKIILPTTLFKQYIMPTYTSRVNFVAFKKDVMEMFWELKTEVAGFKKLTQSLTISYFDFLPPEIKERVEKYLHD